MEKQMTNPDLQETIVGLKELLLWTYHKPCDAETFSPFETPQTGDRE
jgi:hypothetical protein